VKPDLVGLAASTNAVLKNLGALTGITLMVTVFGWMNLPRISPGLSAYHWAFGAAVLVAGLNLLTNLLPRKANNLPRQETEATRK
jgi:hypothetical protein